mmetsp:Transcript_26215/g.61130  ORF Transcript_26215/g.61130 Transcript_26215/m.61130 type:complete len:200 (-) Transcript_26215:492-1091(-)
MEELRAICLLPGRRCHEETEPLLGPPCGGREGNQRVDGVREDRHAHVGEDLEEQPRRGLRRADAREAAKVVRVTRPAAVREGSGHKANVLAVALVRRVVVHLGEFRQRRVHRVDVVEVDKVLGNELPVPHDVIVFGAVELHVVEIVALELLGQVTKHVGQGRRAGQLVQEDDAGKGFDAGHAHEAQVLFALLGHGRWRG